MTITFERHGTGPQHVIVLHEWLSTSTAYREALRYWSLTDFTWILPNYRGYGTSRQLTGAYTAAEMAADVLAVADAAGARQFDVVAHSMSGMVAQLLSLEARERVRRVVLVAAVPGTGAQMTGDSLALFEGAGTGSTESWNTINAITTGQRLGDGWARARLAARSDIAEPAMAAYLRMWNQTDISARLRGLPQPVLCLSGAHDLEVFQEPAYRNTIGTFYTDVSYETLPGAGHFPMLETPPYFAARVEAFLRAS